LFAHALLTLVLFYIHSANEDLMNISASLIAWAFNPGTLCQKYFTAKELYGLLASAPQCKEYLHLQNPQTIDSVLNDEIYRFALRKIGGMNGYVCDFYLGGSGDKKTKKSIAYPVRVTRQYTS